MQVNECLMERLSQAKDLLPENTSQGKVQLFIYLLKILRVIKRHRIKFATTDMVENSAKISF